MSKFILQSFLGLILALAAIYLFFLFILSLNKGGNFLFLIPSLLFAGGGIYFLIRAGKAGNALYTSNMPKEVLATENKTDAADRLAKNNELLGEWKKTNDTKNRLRMLEISASAGDSNSS